jgi:hypothetical protein
MVDGFPYKEEVGGSSPSVPTSLRSRPGLFEATGISNLRSDLRSDLRFEIENSGSHAES